MSKWIDAEWLKEHIEVISYEGMWHETEIDEFVSVENINSAPSIDIVRCKECKHWDTHTMQFAENNLVIARCKQWLQYSRMNGYCHNGERKESE